MRAGWLLVLIVFGLSKSTIQSVSTNTTCDLSKEFDCGTGILGCIPLAWKCDNLKDCHNGEDEVGCEPNNCEEGQLRCTYGSCVKGQYKCDGINDCFYGGDEKHCEYNSRRAGVPAPFNYGDPNSYKYDGGLDKNGCLPGYEFCSLDNICFPNRLFCDGLIHCKGSEDERNCTREEPISKSSWLYHYFKSHSCKDKFSCKTKESYKCIEMEKVCDGTEDCPMGDDESEKCSECSTKNCEYQCTNTPTGAKCICKLGYHLDSDGVKCVDLDECTLPERACHHFCENRIGSFVCSCAKGYHLKADGKSCALTNTSYGTFLVNYDDSINGKPLNDFSPTEPTIIHKINETLEALDYFRRDDKFFIAKIELTSFEKYVRRDQGEREPIKGKLMVGENGKWKTLREVSGVEHLALDWIGENLYITEKVGNEWDFTTRISVCTMDGKFCRGVIEVGEYDNQAFAIHPTRGLLFYTEQQKTGQNITFRIMMANMDGSQIQPLVDSCQSAPKAFTIDYENHEICFTDDHRIQRVNIDTKKTEIVASGFDGLYNLAYHNGFLYWILNNGRLQVQEVAKNNSRIHQILGDQYTPNPHRMVFNDSLHQLEPSHNPCKEIDCPWICVTLPGFTAKCLCPDGYTLSALGTTCIPPSKQIGEQNYLTHIGFELMSEYCKSGVGCLNGGVCREVFNKTRIVCDCVGPYDGLYCERRKPMQSDEAILAIIRERYPPSPQLEESSAIRTMKSLWDKLWS